jgi:cobalt-zinc-cadmium resistance protein CzcA
MIVDASVVIAENITRHLSEAKDAAVSRIQITARAVREVARPLLFAIFIIIVVFVPIFLLQGMEGKMFRPLALTVCFAMLGSLLVSFTIVPVLCSLFVQGRTTSRENALVRITKGSYLTVLSWTLVRRKRTILLASAVLAVALLLMTFIGTEFLPQLNEGAIAVNIVKLPSASLEGSVIVGTEIERRLLEKFSEVETVVTKTGRAEISEDPMGPEQSDVFIMLHPQGDWDSGRNREQLVAAIQKELSKIPGIRLSFSQPIALRVNELVSGIKSDVAIKVFGSDLELLRENASRMAFAIGGIEGAEDVKVEQVAGFNQVEIVVDRKAIARHKINLADINDIIETAVGGKIASTVVEGQQRFAVLVRFPAEYRADLEALERILVSSPEGANVPLGQLAAIKQVEAPAQISRENGLRRVVVESNIRGRDMGGFVSEVQERIESIVDGLPAGYFVEYGGQFENQQRAMRRLSIVVPLSILLIFLMLFSTFNSMRSALLVLVNLPFALIGGIMAMLIFRMSLSVPATIGFIALFGIAVENGTVLITFFNQLRDKGMSTMEAVKRGCELRFRPLLMTALTTLMGLLPLIYATGSGSEIQRPLAIVVLGGLVTSLLLTQIVLPVLYTLVAGREDTELP